MRKLRLIRQRLTDVEVVNDLRGIGNDPLLRNCFPFSGLTLKNISRAKLSPYLSSFELACRETHEDNCHFITAHRTTEGEHKTQAITLFVASLALHQKFTDIGLRLELLSPLHQMMHRRITSANAIDPDIFPAGWKEWGPTELRLGLDPAVQIFLRQAGFDIALESKFVFLSDSQVKHVIQTFQAGPKSVSRTAVKR